MRDDRALIARACSAVVAVAVVLLGTACGGDASPPSVTAASQPSATSQPPPSAKVPDAINQVAANVLAAATGADLAGLSNSLVHVRADGAIEVVLHASDPVSAGQLAELKQLGAEIGPVLAAPAALVQAWVPARQLPAVAALPWVAAITPPAYPPPGG